MSVDPLLPSLFALTGIVIGASLQFFFGRHISREGKYLDKRFDTYLDFVRSLNSEDIDAHMRAQLQMVAYAHDDVLQPFLEFEKLGGYIKTEEQKRAFVRIVRAIRKDAGGKALYTDEDLFYLTMFTTWDDWDKPVKSSEK
jgi:hypothetical protein